MRKISAYVAAIIAALTAMSLSACTPACSEAEAADGVLAKNIASPISDVGSPDDIDERLGIKIFAPAGASRVSYCIIDGTIAQVNFYFDGASCTCRMKKAPERRDVSGVYSAFAVRETKKTVSGVEYTAEYNKGGGGLCLWYDEAAGATCSAYMNTGASEAALEKLAEALIGR